MLTGQNPCEPPYEIYPIRHWNPQLSAGLEAIIQKCTQLNPDDRYQSCAELLYALHHYEEYGAAYRTMQKSKLKKFIITASITVICLCIGIFGLIMRTATNNADYNQNILQAEKASTSDEKANYYATAIDIKPMAIEAYIGMIEAFKDDAAFSTSEEELLKKNLDVNLAQLRTQVQYAELAFELGKLYWYYYDYGKTETADNQITRMKSSIQWFEDAVEYGDASSDNYLMASTYKEIGKFNRDITLQIEEADDKGKYAPYWENLEKLTEQISKSKNENEIIELEIYKLVMYSIENYARKFKADDISQEQMNSLYKAVQQAVSDVSTSTDKTKEVKNDVVERLDSANQAIENAYRE